VSSTGQSSTAMRANPCSVDESDIALREEELGP